jgi:hypothetical protein
MERVAKKFSNFKEAEEWTIRQYREMTPDERLAAARELQRRFFGPNQPDIREWHRRAK